MDAPASHLSRISKKLEYVASGQEGVDPAGGLLEG